MHGIISSLFLTVEFCCANLKYKTSAWACIGVNELHAGFLGNNLFRNWTYHSTNIGNQVVVSNCKYAGMKLENWDAVTCSTLAQVLAYNKHSSH